MSGSAFTVESPPVTPVQGAKAWVTYSTDTGVAVVKDSYNIDSVIRNSTGNCTVNITPGTFASANYVVNTGVGGLGFMGVGAIPVSIQAPYSGTTPTSTSIVVQTTGSTGGVADAQYVSLSFFGN